MRLRRYCVIRYELKLVKYEKLIWIPSNESLAWKCAPVKEKYQNYWKRNRTNSFFFSKITFDIGVYKNISYGDQVVDANSIWQMNPLMYSTECLGHSILWVLYFSSKNEYLIQFCIFWNWLFAQTSVTSWNRIEFGVIVVFVRMDQNIASLYTGYLWGKCDNAVWKLIAESCRRIYMPRTLLLR